MLQESNLGAFLICGKAVNRTFVRVATISWTGQPQTFFQKTLDKHLHLCYNNNRKKRKGQPKMPTFVEMYMNIYKKFGKDSKELAKYKNCYAMYSNNHKVMVRIYKTIIDKPKKI